MAGGGVQRSGWPMASSVCPATLLRGHVFACVLSLTACGCYRCLTFVSTPRYRFPWLSKCQCSYETCCEPKWYKAKKQLPLIYVEISQVFPDLKNGSHRCSETSSSSGSLMLSVVPGRRLVRPLWLPGVQAVSLTASCKTALNVISTFLSYTHIHTHAHTYTCTHVHAYKHACAHTHTTHPR